MASSPQDPIEAWQVRICPNCQAKARVRAAAVSKKALCPRCRFAIPAPEPVLPDEESNGYSVLPTPTKAPPPPEPPKRRRREVVESDPEPPELPTFPLWEGVYGFPWYPTTLRAWFMFGIGFCLVAFMGACLNYIIILYQSSSEVGQGLWFRVFIVFLKAFVMVLLLTGSFAGSYYLGTVQDTAAGIDKVGWPEEGIIGKVYSFLFLAWIFMWAAVPLGVLVTPLKFVFGPQVYAWSLIPTFVFIYPIVLFCSLANDSAWGLVNRHVFESLVRHPMSWLAVFFMSTLLLLPCLFFGWLTISWLVFFLIPVTGYLWSSCLLIHGRLLGRLAGVISDHALATHRGARRSGQSRRYAAAAVDEDD